MTDLDAHWLTEGRALIAQARAGTLHDVPSPRELASEVAGWPDVWIAAALLSFDQYVDGALARVIETPHQLAIAPTGDVIRLLEAAIAASGDARIAALEEAWRACFVPAIADVLEALDRDRAAPAMPVAKKKKETEALWAEAAKIAVPRSLFDGEWPKTWRDAQRRMRPLYARPRSPLLAAAAIGFTERDPLPYTSIASSPYWQAHAWFIAEQGDVRQLAALEAFERRMAPMWRERTLATDALRRFVPRELPAEATSLLAKLAVPARPAKGRPLSLASKEDRAVAADQLLLDGDPRGELIAVQEQIAAEPTPALVKRQIQLLKKHGQTWVPNTVYRDTCVFRGGVPVAGHLLCRSDRELAAMIGSKALVTFEVLIIDTEFAMGRIRPSTVAEFVASLPALRHVVTFDAAARAIAQGAPTAIERLGVDGESVSSLEGPGLPRLARVDSPTIVRPWTETAWCGRLAALGTTKPDDWETWRTAALAPAVVLGDGPRCLHRSYCRWERGWELWAKGGRITAKHQIGVTAGRLRAAVERVPSWEGLELAVPANFAREVKAFAVKRKIALVTTAPVEPLQDGMSLELARALKDERRG
jgi:hypothetical protein